MSRFSIRNNNKGASLILVIGCVALLTVIGGLILVKTANNREMKEREKKAQEAFYEAESGTQIMVSALETCAQNALKSAYVNMLLQYSNQTDAERQTAFVDYFKTALNAQISGDAETFLKEALGLTSEEYAELNLTVSFGTNNTTGVYVTNASGKITDVENIRMNGVTFSYVNPSNNTESTLKTDICLATKVPALDGSMYTETVGCAFTDFALIASGDVGIGTERAVGSGQTAEVNGNMYVGGNYKVEHENSTAKISNAKKALVKGNIDITDKGVLNIENGGVIGRTGQGVWAKGILVSGGGKISGTSNYYVADDLDISGNASSVVFTGNGEYLGYSGVDATSATDASEASSAITINTSTGITLDFSQMARLVLRGHSYIYDTESNWQTSFGGTEQNVGGILQGESVAYKNMQSIYLVPGACLPSLGSNPVLASTYNNLIQSGIVPASLMNMTFTRTVKVEGGTKTVTMDLSQYVNAEKPFETRYVRLDQGTTVFVYLYLNFGTYDASGNVILSPEDAAAKFVNDYIANFGVEDLKERMSELKNSNIKLAKSNHTIANAIAYATDDAGNTTHEFVPGKGATSEIRLDCLDAEDYYASLFSTLDITSAAVGGVDDIVRDAILAPTAFTTGGPGGDITVADGLKEVASGTGCKFYVANNPGSTLTISSNYDGIILVNGSVKFDASSSGVINGLVITTEGVICNSGFTLKANKDMVESLLANEEVAKYFRGYSTGGNQSYLSTEAITVSFENWEKN